MLASHVTETKYLRTVMLDAAGGTFNPNLLRAKTDVLLLLRGEGDKFRHGKQWGIPCVRTEWVTDSIAESHAIPFADYLVSGADHPLSSTPTDASKVNYPDMTACSTILHRTSTNTVDATMCSRISFSSIFSEDQREVIKKAGTFLDGCKVYLCGNDVDKAKILVNGSGAVRLDSLSDLVSHVIVLGPRIPPKDIEALKEFESMPYVVGMEWLTESAKKGSPADEELFTFEGVQDGTNQFKRESSTPAAHSSGNDRAESQGQRRSGSLGDGVMALEREIARFGIISPLPRRESGRSQHSREAEDYEEATSNSEGDGTLKGSQVEDTRVGVQGALFANKKFVVLVQEGTSVVTNMIRSMGGKIVVVGTESYDYAILPPLHSHENVKNTPQFTEQWVVDCNEADSLDIPLEPYHIPLLMYHGAEKILAGVVLALSCYTLSEKYFINSVAQLMGAKIQDVFARKGSAKTGTLATTHLLCPETNNEKYKAAKKWDVPVVRYDWIIDSFKAQRKKSLGRYLVREAEETTSDDSILPTTPGPRLSRSRSCSTAQLSTARSLLTSTLRSVTLQGSSVKNGGLSSAPSPARRATEPGSPSATPYRPPVTPSAKRLSLGNCSDVELTPSQCTQSQSQTTPKSAEDPEREKAWRWPILSGLDLSLGCSPSEVRREMAICVLPSPETPKVEKQVWDAHMGAVRNRIEERERKELEARQAQASLPRVVQPVPIRDFSQFEDDMEVLEADFENMRVPGTSASTSMETSVEQPTVASPPSSNETQFRRAQKRTSDSLSEDEEDEDETVKPKMPITKNSTGNERKKPRSMDSLPESVLEQPKLYLAEEQGKTLQPRRPVTRASAKNKEPSPSSVTKSANPKPETSPPSSSDSSGTGTLSRPLSALANNCQITETEESQSQSLLVGLLKTEDNHINQNPVIMLSGLATADKRTIGNCITELGGTEHKEVTYDFKVSLMVTSVLSRSEKTLGCIADGKPIVKPAYITDSHKHGQFLPITEKYLWQITDAKKSAEKLVVGGFRLWYERIRENPENKPFAKIRVLILESDPKKKDAYKRLIVAGGGTAVEIKDLPTAQLIICDKKDVSPYIPKATRVQIPIREPVFINNVLLQDAQLYDDDE